MSGSKYLEKFDAIVKSFSRADRIALCHDLDADGLSSAAVAFNAIKLLRGKGPDLVITQRFKTVQLLPESVELLKRKKIQKLIVVDFALDQKPESIAQAKKAMGPKGQIIVIDHHKKYGAKQPENVFILKPQDFSKIEPSRYPCAKLSYDLFSRHVGLSKSSWLACVGLIGDNQIKKWKPFVKSEARRHKTGIKELLGVMEIISAVEVLSPRKLASLLRLLIKAKGPRQVLKSKFAKYAKLLDGQVKKLYRQFNSEKEIHPEQSLVWFAFKSRHNIKSAVINRVSNRLYPDKTVIFVQDRGDGYISFSARNQSFKVKTNELLERAVKGFENAGAGGHVPASAGRIMKKDLPAFKRRVLEFLRGGRFSQR